MGDIDEGRLKALVQLGDFGAHLRAQLGVEVGQRLVEQEYRRVAHHRAAECDSLTLTARKRFRLAVQQVLDVQNFRRFVYSAVDFRLVHLSQLETERRVFVDRHMRIQRVVLEYHGDVAVLRLDVVYDLVADSQLAARDLLQTRNHAERRGFAAARRADQNNELFIVNFQVEVVDDLDVARIDFFYMLQGYVCHDGTSISQNIKACVPRLRPGPAWPG